MHRSNITSTNLCNLMLATDSTTLVSQIAELRFALEIIINRNDSWLSPVQISKISRYSAYDIRRAIDRAIADPESSELIDRVHYRRQKIGNRYRYKINWNLTESLI